MQFQFTEQEIYLRKIWRRTEEIQRYLFSNQTRIEGIIYREMREHESNDQAVKAKDYKPINVGDSWGGCMNGWFKIPISIPKEFKGKEVVALIDLGGEACAFLDGKPYAGLDKNHKQILLTEKAKGGEKFEFLVDAVSVAPWDPEALNPEIKNEPSVFAKAEIATRNKEVTEYWFNLDLLYKLAIELPADNTRRAKIIYTLNKSVDAFDYTHTDEDSLKKSAITANEILKPLLDNPANASAIKLAMVGHSHIDVAWKWPYWETKRKCSRTFSTVMRLMEQYPEYIFTQGQAILYEYTKDKYPALYEDIKKRAKEGRWDVTGSMYVEADCNLCSGESLIRQIVLGKNFFMDEFGTETNVLWLPDVFGYSAAIPQILKKARVDYFFTNKIHWSDINKPPYGTFYWKGIDGSKVLAHFPPSSSYNGFPDPSWMLRYERKWQDKDRANEILFTFGWGDGGGGPENRHLEYLRRTRDLEGLPKCEMKSVPQFFADIDNGTDYHEWVGELYLEYHRGTYTTQAKNKRLNRKSEFLYRDAELLSSIATPMGFAYPYEQLNEQWKQILAMQFHDVIPGTSIRQVYEDTDKMYAEVTEVGENIAKNALNSIADKIDTSGEGKAVIVFNSLPWERMDAVNIKVNGKAEYTVLDAQGNEIPTQVCDGEIRFVAKAPSMGYAVYRLLERTPKLRKTEIKASRTSLENKFYKIKLDSKGLIQSIIHKQTNREVLPQNSRGNLLQLFEDKSLNWPAWDIDFFHEDKYEDITQVDSVEVVENGPVSAAVEISRSFRSSKLKQKMVIYSDNPRIDFETWVDWHEDNKVLKVAFPVDVNSAVARYEIQFGNVERNTHRNTSWDFAKFEVAAHKWADISDGGFGMSLMNDCKYGHSTRGNVMRLTLLRAPWRPDPLADRGEHVFTYSIMPHEGDYIEADTVRQAYSLNVPMRAMITDSSKGKLPKEKSFISYDAENIVLETVKKAEKEEATILRFYECHNKRSRVSVKLDMPFRKVSECDLMEDNISDINQTDGGFTFEIKPFEIKTFKIK